METNEQRLVNLMHRWGKLEAALPSDDLDIEQHSDDEEDDDEEAERYIQDIVACDGEEDDSYEDDEVDESEQRFRLNPQEMEKIDFYNNLGEEKLQLLLQQDEENFAQFADSHESLQPLADSWLDMLD